MIGIATGAALTLFIATAMDAPTHPVMDRAKTHLESLWDSLIESTSENLFNAEEILPPPSDDLPAVVEAPEGVERTTERRALPLLAEADPPADADTSQSAPSVEPASVERLSLERLEDPAPGGAHEIPVAALEPPEALPAPRPVNTRFRELEPIPPVALWEPFHSQMSAEGFASRLSEELDHQFRVERQGAGSYQVVFDASSYSERDLLLAQIAEITGR
jgi:hypothetical protein